MVPDPIVEGDGAQQCRGGAIDAAEDVGRVLTLAGRRIIVHIGRAAVAGAGDNLRGRLDRRQRLLGLSLIHI